MQTSTILLLIIILVLTVLNTAPTTSGQQATLLALQWPKSFCSIKGNTCKTLVPLEFNIHGLWLPTQSHPPPILFVRSQVKSIKPDLDTYWPNLLRGQRNYDFWRSEWKTHAASGPFTELGLLLQDFGSRQVCERDKVPGRRRTKGYKNKGHQTGNAYTLAYVAAEMAATG